VIIAIVAILAAMLLPGLNGRNILDGSNCRAVLDDHIRLN